MSREAGRVRALMTAARLQHLLESRDRVELFGYVLVRSDALAPRTLEPVPSKARRETPPDRPGLQLDA